jgi:hypothetical protein
MAQFRNSLGHVKIAAPCTADWDQMFSFENDRVRFCSQCNLNVYNLSAMTQSEAAALVYRTEGRLCVRFHRRVDGTVLTQDCPVGLRAIKQRTAWVAQLFLGMLLGLFASIGLANFKPVRKLAEIIKSEPGLIELGPQHEVMGKLVVPFETESEKPSQKQRVSPKSVRVPEVLGDKRNSD